MVAKKDTWQEKSTVHNLPADEVISALQKEIRRGMAENAVLLAYEMMLTSEELEEKLWSRLLVISVEDIGFGAPQSTILIKTLYDTHLLFTRDEPDRFLFAVHAVRYLCASKKDRSNDEILNWMKIVDLTPEIPDYAIDMHTKKGQALGRGIKQFMTEGALIYPEKEDRETTFRQRLLELLDLD